MKISTFPQIGLQDNFMIEKNRFLNIYASKKVFEIFCKDSFFLLYLLEFLWIMLQYLIQVLCIV